MVKQLLTATGIMASMMLSAQKNFWNQVQNVNTFGKKALKERTTTPTDYKLYNLNVQGLKAELAKAPSRESQDESLVLKFPTADGKLVDYIVKDAPTLSKELAAKYPGINSYVGYQKGNSGNTIRFSTSPFDGINIMYFDNSEVSYLDTYTDDASTFIVYKRENLPVNPEKFNCGYENDDIAVPHTETIANKAPLVRDGQLRTYRLALACTIEYSAFHVNRANLNGGTLEQKKAAVLAAMNASMTRVNGVYEKSLSLTMVIVPDNDKVIFIDSDNFTNNNPPPTYPILNENQTVCDNLIGSTNYDIGHVFSTASGGVAQLRSPCQTGSKARGTTGTNSPINDPFNIDYVAHEIGHQFGGNHTFRSCGGNENNTTAAEPGSGSTIMAYAGICGATNNVQTRSDAYFHSISMNEMYIFISRSTDCSVKTPNNNTVPTADAGPDYTIPNGTAFVLTGQGTDPDGDSITYLWEQIDTASNVQPPITTGTVGPIFRSYFPSVSNERYFPRLPSIIANTLTPKWEVIPSVSRVLNFSLIVNDNKATGNQTARDLMVVNVANAGPFKVTSHTAYLEYNGGEATTITWDVAGTNAAPINTANVQILLSTDAGLTFTTVLGEFPNTGSASVMLPNVNVASARIMIKAVNNIYLAVNSSPFKIKEVLAVNESAFNKGFAIYPNPAKGEVNISLSKAAKDATYQILDLSGKLISTGSLPNEKTQVNISSLKTGTYRIVISNNGETTSKNLIVK
ncbi:reprolysin-like metallopeptidase [Epilithonimonas xixisoli]|uniref:Putative secreted protein (Por secretion system target) n=1 Tax=Epilithonimonas xixisoli TaxID=1476462 RepID=A0A4V3H2E0_9FLAO|nr:zinc-dependent metalloprotease family protein [Epilithonimonas xixisoli]TDX83067.1 putative secreted protein (Por secretion system target) [Epilithonimonas xixisoli]